ncbi:MAG: hypothetical protein QG568_79 [Patescibacteria group bacterium]|nr:hypothetical protein [Patescibacteria group bacterium]
MKTYKNVTEYIQKAEDEKQSILKEVRGIVLATAPDAIEEISYGMPAYTWREKPLFYFAAMKGHLGLYPTPGPILAHKKLLADFSTSKGCIRVSYKEKVPKVIIAKLLKERMREIKSDEKNTKAKKVKKTK